jgi:hypothetical protein
MVAIGSSVTGVYNPIFYANEALIHLENALGMASRVHRGFDSERQSFGKGDTINIRKPQAFTAANAPATAAGLTTETTAITLDNWREVKFALNDKEIAFTGQRIIDDHIRPAAYALADDIDLKLCALWDDIPTVSAYNSDPTINMTGARKALLDNKVPLTPGQLHMMLDTTGEQDALKNSAFTQHQGAGDAGVASQMMGSLGTKFGFESFTNQNVQTGIAAGATDVAGLVDLGAGYAVGSTTIHIDAIENATYNAGCILTFTSGGVAHAYTLAASTATGGTEADFVLASPLRVALADDDAVAITAIDAKSEMLAFHKNAFALVMAPLPEMGNELGAKVATVSDPITGLSVRSRIYYVGNSSQVHVALDCLYGVKTLDPLMAVRVRR